MPLTKSMKEKLQPDFLATLIAVGEAVIASKIPPSVAYSLRDELPFESWPDDAIEATARLVMELRRRLAVATRDLLEAQLVPQAAAAAETAPTQQNKTSKDDRGKSRGTGGQAKKRDQPAAPPTETQTPSPQRDNAA